MSSRRCSAWITEGWAEMKRNAPCMLQSVWLIFIKEDFWDWALFKEEYVGSQRNNSTWWPIDRSWNSLLRGSEDLFVSYQRDEIKRRAMKGLIAALTALDHANTYFVPECDCRVTAPLSCALALCSPRGEVAPGTYLPRIPVGHFACSVLSCVRAITWQVICKEQLSGLTMRRVSVS